MRHNLSQWCNSHTEDFESGAMEQDRDWTDVNDGYPWCHRHGRMPLGFESLPMSRKPEVLCLGSLRLSHDEDGGQLKPLDPR